MWSCVVPRKQSEMIRIRNSLRYLEFLSMLFPRPACVLHKVLLGSSWVLTAQGGAPIVLAGAQAVQLVWVLSHGRKKGLQKAFEGYIVPSVDMLTDFYNMLTWFLSAFTDLVTSVRCLSNVSYTFYHSFPNPILRISWKAVSKDFTVHARHCRL